MTDTLLQFELFIRKLVRSADEALRDDRFGRWDDSSFSSSLGCPIIFSSFNYLFISILYSLM